MNFSKIFKRGFFKRNFLKGNKKYKRYFLGAIFIIVVAIYFYSESNFIKNILPPFFKATDNFSNTQVLVQDLNLTIVEHKPIPFLPTHKNIEKVQTMEDIKKYIFNIEETAYVTYNDLNLGELLQINLKSQLQSSEPKVLIFHTHSQEDFLDSALDEPNDTIVGIGVGLAEILSKKYGISVVHDIGSYDLVNGKLVRGGSYEKMEPAVKNILEKYPTIEVAIDLHRDGVPENVRLVENINGKDTAKVMFFNGIARYNDNGVAKELKNLENPYIKENLALSLNLFLTANELYPGFARKNYIKPYRYSLHMLPKSMLVEVGANTNTVQEAKNAIEPLAEVIVKTLSNQ